MATQSNYSDTLSDTAGLILAFNRTHYRVLKIRDPPLTISFDGRTMSLNWHTLHTRNEGRIVRFDPQHKTSIHAGDYPFMESFHCVKIENINSYSYYIGFQNHYDVIKFYEALNQIDKNQSQLNCTLVNDPIWNGREHPLGKLQHTAQQPHGSSGAHPRPYPPVEQPHGWSRWAQPPVLPPLSATGKALYGATGSINRRSEDFEGGSGRLDSDPVVSAHQNRRHVATLTNLTTMLVANMEADELLIILQSSGVLDSHETELVRTRRTSQDKNIELIEIMKMKTLSDFLVFVKALESTNQQHIADEICENI